jgi:hypothetical protein
MVRHTCYPSYLGSKGRKIKSLRPAWAKGVRPLSQNKFFLKRTGGIAEVVDGLPSMYEGLWVQSQYMKEERKGEREGGKEGGREEGGEGGNEL